MNFFPLKESALVIAVSGGVAVFKLIISVSIKIYMYMSYKTANEVVKSLVHIHYLSKHLSYHDIKLDKISSSAYTRVPCLPKMPFLLLQTFINLVMRIERESSCL